MSLSVTGYRPWMIRWTVIVAPANVTTSRFLSVAIATGVLAGLPPSAWHRITTDSGTHPAYRMREWRHPNTWEIHWQLERRKASQQNEDDE